MGPSILRIEGDGLLEAGDGIVHLALALQHNAQVVVGRGVLAVESMAFYWPVAAKSAMSTSARGGKPAHVGRSGQPLQPPAAGSGPVPEKWPVFHAFRPRPVRLPPARAVSRVRAP